MTENDEKLGNNIRLYQILTFQYDVKKTFFSVSNLYNELNQVFK